MENLVLLVKSYSKHIDHTSFLIEQLKKHNVDQIKTYLTIPKKDHNLFVNKIGSEGYELLYDEDILQDNLDSSWFAQQLVKMKFSDLGLCKNYFWMDGDSYFIKDFTVKDFMYTDTIPYTHVDEQKDLFQWTSKYPQLHSMIIQSYTNDRMKVMDVFGRKGKLFDYGQPLVWSVEVLNHMKENYLKPNNITFEDLLTYMPGELIWYGEYLLTTNIIPIVTCEAWFKGFHYLQQMEDYRNEGHTEETIAKNFLGIVMPSKETNQLRF